LTSPPFNAIIRHEREVLMQVQLIDIDDGSKTPIFSYCRKLISEGVDPSTSLEVYRGDILAMKVNVGNGASLTVEEETSTGTPRFRKYKPFPKDKMPEKRGGKL
jgi:hypothetical protein